MPKRLPKALADWNKAKKKLHITKAVVKKGSIDYKKIKRALSK